MKQTEELMLQEIGRLFADLEVATYGKEKSMGHFIRPDARRFYFCTKRIFDTVDELVDRYHPDYIAASDYNYICDSKRKLLLELDVFKDRNRLEGDYLTYKLEDLLVKLHGILVAILSKCNSRK